MDLRTDLLTATERHCAATGMSKARLSTIVINDGKFFKRIHLERLVRQDARNQCRTCSAAPDRNGVGC